MLKPIEVAATDYLFGADAVCVLYAKVKYALQDGTPTESSSLVSGVFQSCTLETAPRQDEEGFRYVYVWCDVNEITFDELEIQRAWVVLKVPVHGYIEIPNYCGEVITHINVIP